MLSSSADVSSARSRYKSIPRSHLLCRPVNPSSHLHFENGFDCFCIVRWMEQFVFWSIDSQGGVYADSIEQKVFIGCGSVYMVRC